MGNTNDILKQELLDETLSDEKRERIKEMIKSNERSLFINALTDREKLRKLLYIRYGESIQKSITDSFVQHLKRKIFDEFVVNVSEIVRIKSSDSLLKEGEAIIRECLEDTIRKFRDKYVKGGEPLILKD